ncbi:MAG TPA: RagB/SusD family nutrient uptake outer membrane protein [Bacteroides reticulotermitis]|nr:RagB/SusD family nutrient uptake outer membrane protein [Bacteroides reticulotermitis]
MKNKFYYIGLGVVCTLSLTGCSDFLEGKSQDEVIVTTTKDYAELLLGSGYPSAAVAGYNNRLLDNLSDDVDFPQTVSESASFNVIEDDYFPRHTWQATFYEYGAGVELINTEYYQLYRCVMGCNAVLDGIDKAIGPQNERDRIKAEALAARALHYFTLVNLYGEPYDYNKQALGVPLKLTAILQEKGSARNTVEEVYRQILDDLNEAASLLEQYDVTEKDFKINLPAVRILLSRVYLFMEEWKKSSDEATKAMEYGLGMWDLTTVTMSKDASGNDIYPQPNSYDSPEVFWCYSSTNWGKTNDVAPVPSESFLGLYDVDPNDVRFGEAGFYVSPLFTYDWATGTNKITGYQVRKSNLQTGNTTTVLGAAVRLSEAYLNRAEAYAQLGMTSEAISDLNTIRRNRIKGYVDQTDFPDLLEAIHIERRKEFCFEGYRWFDLRRYGMPAIHHDFQATASSPRMRYTLSEKDMMYTLPIPNSVIWVNQSIKQNASASTPVREGTNIN